MEITSWASFREYLISWLGKRWGVWFRQHIQSKAGRYVVTSVDKSYSSRGKCGARYCTHIVLSPAISNLIRRPASFFFVFYIFWILNFLNSVMADLSPPRSFNFLITPNRLTLFISTIFVSYIPLIMYWGISPAWGMHLLFHGRLHPLDSGRLMGDRASIQWSRNRKARKASDLSSPAARSESDSEFEDLASTVSRRGKHCPQQR